MDATYIIVLLALFTFLAFIIFALVSKKKTEDRKNDPNAPKSSLASDADSNRRAP